MRLIARIADRAVPSAASTRRGPKQKGPRRGLCVSRVLPGCSS